MPLTVSFRFGFPLWNTREKNSSISLIQSSPICFEVRHDWLIRHIFHEGKVRWNDRHSLQTFGWSPNSQRNWSNCDQGHRLLIHASENNISSHGYNVMLRVHYEVLSMWIWLQIPCGQIVLMQKTAALSLLVWGYTLAIQKSDFPREKSMTTQDFWTTRG